MSCMAIDREKLVELRGARGWSQARLAREAGVSQQLIGQLETGKNTSTRHITAIARALGVSVSDIDPMFADALGSNAEVTPGSDLIGARDLPIYGSAMGGNGQLVVDFNPIEYVKRPSILEGVKGAYGVRVVGESMEPAYWQGDLALVHPHLPPERDTDVILFDAPPDGPTEAAIKRLTGYSGTEWRLRQYNPARDWAELRVDWPVCHRVVGKYARR